MRRAGLWLAAAALAVACGSKDDNDHDDEGGAAALRAAAERAQASRAADPDADEVAACHEAGDPGACVRVALQLAASPQRAAEAKQYRGLACLFGDGASCAVVAEGDPFPATWHGRACRRGFEPSCAKVRGAARFPAAIAVEVSPPGEAAAHIARAYRGAVEDCLMTVPERAGEPAAIAFELAVDGNRVISVSAPEGTDRRVEACIEKSSAQWRFPAADEPATLTLTVRWPAR